MVVVMVVMGGWWWWSPTGGCASYLQSNNKEVGNRKSERTCVVSNRTSLGGKGVLIFTVGRLAKILSLRDWNKRTAKQTCVVD